MSDGIVGTGPSGEVIRGTEPDALRRCHCGLYIVGNGGLQGVVDADGDVHLVAACPPSPGSVPGVKLDAEKDRWDLLPIVAVQDVVKVLGFGARKYAPENWRKVPDARARYYSAAMRHLAAWRSGETLDPESQLPHLAHAMCCLTFIATLDAEAGR